MKSLLLGIAAAVFATVTTAEAEEVRYYNLTSWHPSGAKIEIPTTIYWENIKGLGSLSGVFDYAAAPVHFSGSNPRVGLIAFTDENGSQYEFIKAKTKDGFEWTSSIGKLIPTTKPKPTSTPTPPSKGGTERFYTFRDENGNTDQVRIVWADIKGNGAIEVQFASGEIFHGSNPRSGYIEFASDLFRYELTREKSGNSFRWVGVESSTLRDIGCSLTPTTKSFTPQASNPKPAGNVTRRTYQYNDKYGTERVTIDWSNINGLGPITVHFASGAQWSGNNSRSGFITFGSSRVSYELSKQTIPGGFQWVGTMANKAETIPCTITPVK